MAKDFSKLSKEELLKLVEKQGAELDAKKYGLVWDREREPEQVVLDCENNLPILKRIAKKEIRTNESDDNIFIEGDNYHSLTVLNYTHKGKIDFIYIDPPYNTGNKDFVYNDKYIDKEDIYRHSKWLNFMEKRLILAKNLLKDAGIIFISIDDNEVAQLKLLCDKIFGGNNFIAQIIWRKKYGGGKGSRYFVDLHEYIVCYAIDKNKIKDFNILRTEEKKEIFKLEDEYIKERGRYYIRPLKSGLALRKTLIYPIRCPDGSFIETQWICAKDTFETLLNDGRIVFKKLKTGKYNVYKKFYEKDNEDSVLPESIFYDLFYNQNGKEEIKSIFGIKEGRDIPFDNPKPKNLISYLIDLSCKNKNALVLDFMAGSGTTGHAVLEMNKKDSGHRRFILCTNNDLNGVGSDLAEKNPNKAKEKFGICQRVTHPRLEKVIKGYNKNGNGEWVDGLGGNLQYYKTDLIPVERIDNINDKQRHELTEKVGQMIAIKENTFEEVEISEWYQIFENKDKTRKTAIYFRENTDKFNELVGKIKNTKTALYIFSYGEIDKKLFTYLGKNIKVEDIPEPILDIYKEINQTLTK